MTERTSNTTVIVWLGDDVGIYAHRGQNRDQAVCITMFSPHGRMPDLYLTEHAAQQLATALANMNVEVLEDA